MNTIVEEAVTLRRLEYGEADRIVTLLTKSHGKISVIAKGVRRPKSKLAGGIEVFSVNSISYIDNGRELKTLVSARAKQHFGTIITNLASTQVAYDILLFTHDYTEVVCEDDYYKVCVDALTALDNGIDVHLVAVWFGICILQISGHGLRLTADVEGTKLQLNDTFSYDYQDMAFKVDASGKFTSQHIKLLRLCSQVQLQKLQSVQNVQQLSADLQQIIMDSLKYNSHKNLN